MRFIDEANITVRSGKGGDGVVRFHREKFITKGGPSGGDGGKGGDVIFIADHNVGTLADIRVRRNYNAKDGQEGGSNQRTGAGGANCVVRLPVGTLIKKQGTGELVCDLVDHDQRVIVAKGGKGGLGNIHFASSRNQSPRKATEGGPCEEFPLTLELKLLADVGLIGFPNAGKSTLISKLSSAKPRVADYPFTTLIPNLGVVSVGEEGEYVIADIPGLIEGASSGAGLGHRFLKHVERTTLFVHMVSMVEFSEDTPFERYQILNKELVAYNDELLAKTQLVVLTKADAVASQDEIDEMVEPFTSAGIETRVISSVSGLGLQELRFEVWRMLQQNSEGTEADEYTASLLTS